MMAHEGYMTGHDGFMTAHDGFMMASRQFMTIHDAEMDNRLRFGAGSDFTPRAFMLQLQI